jgi:membrane-associated phospholipid phosphatase
MAVAEQEQDDHRLQWAYPRFRVAEAVAAGLTQASVLIVESTTRNFRDSSWDGPILFDSWVRRQLVARSFDSRKRASEISDILWPATQYFPVVESLFAPLVTDKFNVDVAVQMSLINWQVMGVTHLLTRMAQHVTGRDRPSLQHCAEDPRYDPYCDSASVGRTASFISGHTSMSFASAALTCAHHQALPLYGGTALDFAACGLTVTSATAVGVLRIVADRHWPSDVVAGALIGVATGYGMPWLLHYGQDERDEQRTGAVVDQWAWIPTASDSTLGVAALGVF